MDTDKASVPRPKGSRNGKKAPGILKKWASRLHLWLGMIIGILVFIISITGCLYVFKDEIENQLRKQAIFHGEPSIESKTILPLRVLEAKVQEQCHEKYNVHWVDVPMDKKRSYQFYYYETDPGAWNYFDEYIIYKTAYVNPFTGKVLAVYDEKNGFFNIVKIIHWSFLLNSGWGKYVVGIPVLIFLVMLITGIILWWPKNKKARKQRFWFQWKNVRAWRRKNYDLHSILGFYASFIALIVAITGLFYAFTFVQNAIYFSFSGGKTTMPDFSGIVTTAPDSLRNEQTLDKIGRQVEALYPTAFGYSVDLGNEHLDSHEHPNFSVYVKQLGYSYHIMHQLIFDENSGALLKNYNHREKNLGEKAIGANYDVHVGAILGLPTKIIAFIASLICASLPVTGFLVWYGRRRKKKKPKPIV
ncbi:PepSY-associated TM helix domain-containing protein [Niabella aurantiaca]|uniref:PepSY-associated TM helix domain-containing protein n=1 Tax=Niabella aurantiaca TaxID=379900 RepID=UPI000363DCD8|nr:PepSY-associated TM helix domain-containing protein [Niabella aurantiaca]